MTLEEILAALNAIAATAEAANRPMNVAELDEYERLEGELAVARRAAEARARNEALNMPAPGQERAAQPRARVVSEPGPYRMRVVTNRITGRDEFRFDPPQQGDHVFAADLHAMARARDEAGETTDAGRRVMAGFRRALNADVQSDDINELNPTILRQDMYVDQRDYRTPLMDLIGRGAPPNGIQPFLFPKYSSSSGLVADHTEGTEPAGGTLVTTSQTVQPTAISGKASITREVWDMGGVPSVSGILMNQMVRAWREGMEAACATFLNTLTAATDIALTTGAADDALAGEWEQAVAGLQFIRGYDLNALVLEQVLFKKFAAAKDGNNRPLYPMQAPQNANGTAATRFRTMDLAGVLGIPSWALPSTPGSTNNSWLFDTSVVYGWWTQPTRFEFPGTDQSDGSYAPLAFVDLAIWGYKAFACIDTAGVRQVTYDSTP